jgi:hypothetical protein
MGPARRAAARARTALAISDATVAAVTASS